MLIQGSWELGATWVVNVLLPFMLAMRVFALAVRDGRYIAEVLAYFLTHVVCMLVCDSLDIIMSLRRIKPRISTSSMLPGFKCVFCASTWLSVCLCCSDCLLLHAVRQAR